MPSPPSQKKNTGQVLHNDNNHRLRRTSLEQKKQQKMQKKTDQHRRRRSGLTTAATTKTKDASACRRKKIFNSASRPSKFVKKTKQNEKRNLSSSLLKDTRWGRCYCSSNFQCQIGFPPPPLSPLLTALFLPKIGLYLPDFFRLLPF